MPSTRRRVLATTGCAAVALAGCTTVERTEERLRDIVEMAAAGDTLYVGDGTGIVAVRE